MGRVGRRIQGQEGVPPDLAAEIQRGLAGDPKATVVVFPFIAILVKFSDVALNASRIWRDDVDKIMIVMIICYLRNIKAMPK
jgi:hypothetical protein